MRRHFYGFISAFSISLIITVSGFAVQNSGIKEGRNPAAIRAAKVDPLAMLDLTNIGHKPLRQNRNSLSVTKSVSVGSVREKTLANGRIQRSQDIESDGKYRRLRRIELLERNASGGLKVVSSRTFVADHLIVQLAAGKAEKDIAAALKKLGGKWSVSRRLKGGALVVSFPADDPNDFDRSMTELKKSPAVRSVDTDDIVQIAKVPNDPRFAELWGMNNTGQTGGIVDADIDAPEAWDITTGNKLIRVGVIDTGIDYVHTDLAANMWTNPGEIPDNLIDDDDNGYKDDVHGWDFCNGDSNPMDDHSHGTHCSGTIAGVGNNGIGVAGVNWTSELVALKFLGATGSGALTDAMDAIRYATDMGCKITSNSWGGGSYNQALADAITYAQNRGCLFIAAAGNSAFDNDVAMSYPSSFPNDNIIAVLALDCNDQIAWWSNFGRNTVDIGAPGVSILSSVIDNSYALFSGTSMATPHVTGVAALMWSQAPAMNYLEVRQKLLDAAVPVPAIAAKCVTGGRLNAYIAVSSMPTVYPHYVRNEIDDVSGGNGDGIINPGEQIKLKVTLGNLCPINAENVTALLSISPADAAVNVVSSTANFGTIESQAEAVGDTDYVIQIQPLVSTPHSFTCRLAVSAAGGGVLYYNFNLGIYNSYTVSGIATLDGGGIGGFTVKSEGGFIERAAVTAGDGRYSLTLAGGAQQIRIVPDQDNKSRFLVPDPAALDLNSSVTLDFTFNPATVSGQVMNGETGLPAAGGTVIWYGDLTGKTTCGPDGRYSINFGMSRPGKLNFKARLEGILTDSDFTVVTIPPSAVIDFTLHGPQYRIDDVAELINAGEIGHVSGKINFRVLDMSENGELIGFKNVIDPSNVHGYEALSWYYDGNTTHWLEYPDPNAELMAIGLNNNGWITGFVWWDNNVDLSVRGFIRKPDNTWTLLEHMGSPRWDNGVYPEKINDNGTVIGSFEKPDWSEYPAVWQDGQIKPLPCPSGGGWTYGINESDLIVGVAFSGQALLWENLSRIDLPPAANASYPVVQNEADYINNAGVIVGCHYYNRKPDGKYAFYSEPVIWVNRTAVTLPLLDAPDDMSPWGSAVGINDANLAVGSCVAPMAVKRNDYCAVAWENGRVIDLNSWIVASQGWELNTADFINNAGQVCGTGQHDSKERVYLLSPLNLPPRAFITATPSSGPPPLAVTFDSAGSTDKEGPIVSYDWDFGDGATGSGATAVHTYTASGVFTASLTVTDDGGKTGRREVTISTIAPDLVMTTGTAALTSTGKLTVNTTVRNNGTLDAPAGFDAGAWLSSDSVLDGLDIELWSTVRGTALTIGSSWSSSSTITGSNITPGAWHVLIATDSGRIIQELSETNNIVDVPMELRPNLSVSSATWTVSGSNVGGTFKIKNDGFAKLPGASRAGVYLSVDDNVTNTDYLCGTYTTTSAGLDYAEMDTKTVSFAIPGNVPAGTYTLGIIADDNGQVIESDETDNVKIRSTPVVVSGGSPPGQASNPSPSDGAGGVGLDADLSWTAGIGATSHDVYFGTVNSPPFTGNVTVENYALPSLSVGITYYWRINEKNSAGSTAGALWSFTTVSGKAYNPSPANGAKNVDAVSADLSWTAGIGATSHDVYFGSTSSPVFIVNQTSTVYDLNNSGYNWPDLEMLAGHWLIVCPPGDCGNADLNSDGMVDLIDLALLGQSWMVSSPVLEAGKTYYWRIDEHNAGGTVTGDLWSFTTAGGMPECMVSHWKLDETSGTTAADSTGSGHTGTLIEGTAGSLIWSAGHIGGALNFDGDGPSNNVNSFCRVSIPTTGLSVSSGTVALWADLAASGPVNYSSRNNFLYMFGAKGGTTNDRIYISTLSTDLGLDIGIGSTTVNNAVTLTRSSWYHVALVWDAGAYTLYVNGTSVKTGSFGSLVSLSAADIGNKGESTYNQSFHGLIDDVSVYNCALTAEEIAALAGQ